MHADMHQAVARQEPKDTVALLTLDDVGFTYRDGTMAVDSVSLAILPAKVVSIVGPSGCGKSTLLALIAGLVQPSHGLVRRGPQLSAEVRGQRPFTMVFQKDTLLPWLTVSANIAFGLRYLAIDDDERRNRTDRLLRLGRLEEFARAYPYQLSGGMRRRVAFLTGVAPLPRLLLLDEPFSALDEPTRVEVHRDVLSIVYELGMSVVLVTHDLAEAVSLSDDVHILTRRPARVAATHTIPFGHTRDVLTVRETDAYQELYRGLWAEMRQQIIGPAAS